MGSAIYNVWHCHGMDIRQHGLLATVLDSIDVLFATRLDCLLPPISIHAYHKNPGWFTTHLNARICELGTEERAMYYERKLLYAIVLKKTHGCIRCI